jgi:hypothetical protein
MQMTRIEKMNTDNKMNYFAVITSHSSLTINR